MATNEQFKLLNKTNKL